MSVILSHLNAIAASVELLKAQIDAARYAITAHGPAAASAPGPCAEVGEHACAKRSEDARVPVMGGEVVCTGCQQRLASSSLT